MGQQKNRGIIGILTGGGDVPGLNPAIRAVTIRALREGWGRGAVSVLLHRNRRHLQCGEPGKRGASGGISGL